MPKGAFPDSSCQSPHPCGEALPTHVSKGDPPSLAGSFCTVSYGVTAPFLWGLVHARFCLCLCNLKSLFPPVLWKSCNQIPLGFKVRFPGIPSPFVGSSAWEAKVGFQTFTTVGELFWYYCSPVCGSPIWQVWDLPLSWLAPATISLRLLLCLGAWGIFFW